ncbi:four helix bundle protein [Candidatus Gracilibacteria bacterium]|nr:four helix bundle protein [Candidatus Gracilibacteria bacterium]
MTNDKIYNLEERTAKFGEDIIKFAKKLSRTLITNSIIEQLIRSGTSIGANYCEADCAETRKDFEHKLGICKKESRETKHWLRMISTALPEEKDKARYLWKESNELNLIFVTIVKNSKNNLNKNI